MTFKRSNGRAHDALRPVSIVRGFTRHAEGSVLVSFGDTRVLCTASVEEKVPPHKRGSGEGWLTAEYGMLPRSTHTRSDREAARGKQSGRTQEIQRLIGRSLRCVFDLAALGERTISLDCDVLQADGGTRTAAITGAFVAAHDAVAWLMAQGKLARSPIRDFVAAVSVGIVEGTPLLDLEYVEDSACDTDMNVVMTGAGGFVELQGTAEGATFSRAEMDALLALADKGIGELVAAQRAALALAPLPRRAREAGPRLQQPRQARELAALLAPLGIELVAQGALGDRRSRGAARDLRRERAGQGAPCARARRAARRSPTTRACASTRSAARRASPRRTTPPIERRRRRRPRGASPRQDAANNALLLERLRGERDRRARFVAHAGRSCAAPTIPSRWSRSAAGRARCSTRRAAAAASATTRCSSCPRSAAPSPSSTRRPRTRSAIAPRRRARMLALMREAWRPRLQRRSAPADASAR